MIASVGTCPNPSIPGYGGIFPIVEIQFERWSDLNRLKTKNDNHWQTKSIARLGHLSANESDARMTLDCQVLRIGILLRRKLGFIHPANFDPKP
ncbi:MAG: hypothetical protein RIB93_31030 [Coleofasciculus sp. D1-CHI-01]|uniref:hypothetical protein n=1 Tax=Coleofasciculus sp. D1-CHI-01 TaxID=3068482 RepID=UPI0032FC0EA7